MNLPPVSSASRESRALSTFLLSLFLVLLTSGSPSLRAQQAPTQKDSLLAAVNRQIDAGDFRTARMSIWEALKRFPDSTIFVYKMALILHKEEKYAESLKMLKAVLDAPDANDRYYHIASLDEQLLGDMSTAITTCMTGLKRFPNSGPLHLQLGNMAAEVGNEAVAVGSWERGIERDPRYPSNYFHMARYLMESADPGWGLIYGESFINLEGNSRRSDIIRQTMWIVWNVSILGWDDPETAAGRLVPDQISLFTDSVATLDTATGRRINPFGYYFQKAMGAAAGPLMSNRPDSLTIEHLHELRRRFLTAWFSDRKASSHFAVELFEQMRTLEEMGLLKTYDHLIFMTKANMPEARRWFAANPEKIEALHAWQLANQFALDSSIAFARLKAGGIVAE